MAGVSGQMLTSAGVYHLLLPISAKQTQRNTAVVLEFVSSIADNEMDVTFHPSRP